jgi:hypothetical protein
MAANADETDEAADKRLPGWIRAGRVKSTNSSRNVRGSDIRDNFGTFGEQDFPLIFRVGETPVAALRDNFGTFEEREFR